jgi:AmmeMemoRadiSam system protein A
MSSNEADLELSSDCQRLLLDVAGTSIETSLSSGKQLEVNADNYPQPLQALRSTFVTLRIDGELRGCMGSLEATEPLVLDVARNAYSAAFRDSRFEKLKHSEFSRLDIHVSILSTAEPLSICSEDDLLQQMRPGIDGLTLYEGERKGTLLPAVWTNVPDPRVFLKHLKQKAGLSPHYWSQTVRVERYTAVSIKRPCEKR